jgi:hypothetical protein
MTVATLSSMNYKGYVGADSRTEIQMWLMISRQYLHCWRSDRRLIDTLYSHPQVINLSVLKLGQELHEFRQRWQQECNMIARVVRLEREVGRPLDLFDIYPSGRFTNAQIDWLDHEDILYWLLNGDGPISSAYNDSQPVAVGDEVHEIKLCNIIRLCPQSDLSINQPEQIAENQDLTINSNSKKNRSRRCTMSYCIYYSRTVFKHVRTCPKRGHDNWFYRNLERKMSYENITISPGKTVDGVGVWGLTTNTTLPTTWFFPDCYLDTTIDNNSYSDTNGNSVKQVTQVDVDDLQQWRKLLTLETELQSAPPILQQIEPEQLQQLLSLLQQQQPKPIEVTVASEREMVYDLIMDEAIERLGLGLTKAQAVTDSGGVCWNYTSITARPSVSKYHTIKT